MPPSLTEADRLASRMRAALPSKGRTERRMFGGLCFMLDGNMVAGSSKRGMLVRVGRDGQVAALARPGVMPMEMAGRVSAGYVHVDPSVLDDASLRDWLGIAVSFVRTLPKKTPSPKKK